MEFASNFLLLCLGIVSLLFYLTWLVQKAKFLPPGPPNWPIVGSLFYLSKLPHRSMEELAKKYGPIMYLRLGYVNFIIISNARMAMEVLKTHDANFASRPRMLPGKYFGFEWSDIVFSPYGDHWRLLRKICVTKLLTRERLNSFELGRQAEVTYMVENITKHSEGGKFVEMRHFFFQLSRNVICRMLFGTRHEPSNNIIGNDFDDFFKSTLDIGEVITKFNVSDVIPFLKPFDLQGIERQMKRAIIKIDNHLSNILMEYRKGNKVATNSTTTDFVETLLSLDEKLDDKSIMGLLVDIIVGATHTTAITLEWALRELIHHPEMMKKAHEELDRIVGKNRPVIESDLPNLPYLQAIIKETFRLHPVGPITIPHLNTKDVEVLNYKIPANTIMIVNIWAIGRDPKAWENPLEFDPNRFLTSNIGVEGSNYNLLPFGSGRRGCVGLDLAQIMVQYGLATILHAFDWSSPPGVKPKDMNMMEIFGATCPPFETLVAVSKPRLSPHVYKRFD